MLTGGSGYLGSLLAVEIIKQGDQVVFLGRGKAGKTFRERIIEQINKIDQNIDTSQIVAIDCDLNERFLGIDKGILEVYIGKIDGFWHLAANLSFKGKDKNEVISTNVTGIKNIIDLTAKLKCPLYFVSTAYVCGRQAGAAYEDLTDKPRGFNNAYEKSKYIAEGILRESGKINHTQYIIFRPSILISTDIKQLSYFGYYNVVYSLYKWSQKFKKLFFKPIFIFPYYKRSILNLMPVETAVDWMLAVAADKRSLNRTFHITNPKPFAIKDVARQTYDTLGIRLLMFSAPKFFISVYLNFFYLLSFLSPSRKVAKKFYYYKNYIMQDIVFDMRNTAEIIGQEKIDKLDFSENFIKETADMFIGGLDKNK